MIFTAGKYRWDLSRKTLIMGILNVTPDSFSDGGKYFSADKAVEHGLEMAAEGADIIDIGGESTRPGSEPIGEEEERMRVVPVVEKLAGEGIPVSIDTYKASVAEEALKRGAAIVNDISGLRFDSRMADTTARYDAGLVIMHILGTPRNMQSNPKYDNLLEDIKTYLLDSAVKAVEAGINKDAIVIDPGIGFGKTVKDNLEIIKNTGYFKETGFPVLMGISRKSFIGKILNAEVDERLYGTIGTSIAAAMLGADILRVHDVKAARQALDMADAIMGKSRIDG